MTRPGSTQRRPEAGLIGALEELPEGWLRLRDLAWPSSPERGGPAVVAGPGGIFVIDLRDVQGEVRLTDRAFTVDGRPDEAAVAAAVEASRTVREAVGHLAYSVRGVVCFVRGEELAGWAGELMVCTTANLMPLLVSRRTVLTPDQLDSAVVATRAALSPNAPPRRRARPSTGRPSAPSALPPGLPGWAQGPAFRVPEPEPATRGRRQGGTRLASLAAGLALVSGTVLIWPQVSGLLSEPPGTEVAEEPRRQQACGAESTRCDNQRRKAAVEAETRTKR